MKPRRLAVIVAACVMACAGCESTRRGFVTGWNEKISGPVYVRRVVPGEAEAVFATARATALRMGFRIIRSGSAQGVIEGVSGIASDDRLRGSRQRTIKVRLSPRLEGDVEVAVLFTEIVEDDFSEGAGRATEVSLREHPLYAVFFSGLGLKE